MFSFSANFPEREPEKNILEVVLLGIFSYIYIFPASFCLKIRAQTKMAALKASEARQ